MLGPVVGQALFDGATGETEQRFNPSVFLGTKTVWRLVVAQLQHKVSLDRDAWVPSSNYLVGIKMDKKFISSTLIISIFAEKQVRVMFITMKNPTANSEKMFVYTPAY